jgi:hypothetical protein
MVALGVGNLIEDDGGPLYGRIVFAVVLVGGAALIASGIWTRRTRRELGSKLVAVGVLPAASGVAFLWFPPAVAVGLLALVSSVAGFRDSAGQRMMSMKRAITIGGIAVVAVVVLTMGAPA